jgi:hypothetical protein
MILRAHLDPSTAGGLKPGQGITTADRGEDVVVPWR